MNKALFKAFWMKGSDLKNAVVVKLPPIKEGRRFVYRQICVFGCLSLGKGKGRSRGGGLVAHVSRGLLEAGT